FRAESGRIAGTHFLSALGAVWHLDQSRSSYFMSFAPDAVTSSPAIPYSWQGEPDSTGASFDKRSAYENDNEIQDLPPNGGDNSDGGACHPGGGTATSAFQVPSKERTPSTHQRSLQAR